MEIYNRAFKEIEKAKKIFLASHISPDGDNLGSLLAMYHYLKSLNKEVYAIEDDEIPDNLLFLPGVSDLVKSNNLEDCDLFIAIDCADMDRLSDNSKFLFQKAKSTINIDHHNTNTEFGMINIVDRLAPAAGEVLFYFFKSIEAKLNREIAICLYTAISSDTGSFKYDSTRKETFEAARELLDYEININKIAVELYQNRSLNKTNLLIKAMNTLTLYNDGKIGVVYVTEDMIKQTDAKKLDTDGIVEFLRDINGIEVALFFKIKKDSIKLSTRTKSYVDATKIVTPFGGGGHIRAAGATLKLPYESRLKEVLELVSENL